MTLMVAIYIISESRQNEIHLFETMEEGQNDFAIPMPSEQKPTKVKIKSETNGSRFAREERVGIVNYGDLPDKAAQIRRPYEESVWTNNKAALEITSSPALADTEADMARFMLIGVTERAAYALEGCTPETVELIESFKKAHHEYEVHALQQYLQHTIDSVSSKSLLKTKIEFVQSLQRQDVHFKDVLQKHQDLLEKKYKAAKEDTTKHVGVVIADRGDDSAPEITTTRREFEMKDSRVTAEKNAVFQLWQISGTGEWKPVESVRITSPIMSVPSVSVCDDRLVWLSPVSTSRVELSVYRILESHKITLTWRASYELDIDTFGTHGQIVSSHVDRKTHLYSMAIGKGAMVCYIGGKDSLTAEPVFVSLGKESKLSISAVSTAAKMVLLGTLTGECFGIDLQTGEIRVTEVVPALEPIFGVTYSNQRIIMQTVSSICGVFMPYHSPGLRQIETPRPRALQVVGTLLFVLDKYGYTYIYSTMTTGITFPFKPPKDISIGMEYACQAYYTGAFANATCLRVLHPNGLIQHFEISSKMQRFIDNNVFASAKQKKRDAKKNVSRK